MNNQANSLTEGHISTTLLKFASPFLLSTFLQALYGAVDLFVVGRFADPAAVSAVSIGSQVMQTLTGIVNGIAMGGTVLIGHRIGAKDNMGAAKAVGTLAILFGLMAVLLTPTMMLCTNSLVSLMETPAQAVAGTKEYIFICSCGIPFIIGYNAVSGIFRGMGDSKTPVLFIAIACAVNTAGNFFLVGFLKMSTAGSAISTVTAQAISFIFALIYMTKKRLAFDFSHNDIKADKESAKRILKVGFPLALQDALVNVSFLIISAVINTMGLVASASVGVVEKIIVFAMLPPSAFASAVAVITAQNIGAGKPKRACKSLWFGIGFSLIFGISACVYAQLLPQTVTAIFTRDNSVIIMAAGYLKSYSIDCVLVSFIFCMNAYFSGCGKSIISFIHSMVATFGVRIPMTIYMSGITGTSLYLMGFASPSASIISLIICLGYLRWISHKESY